MEGKGGMGRGREGSESGYDTERAGKGKGGMRREREGIESLDVT